MEFVPKKKPILVVTDKGSMTEFEKFPMPGEEVIAIQPSHAMGALMGMEADLLLLDCENAIGLELLRTIKKRHSGLPVIFIAGQGSEDLVLQVFRSGARDYHRRPIARQTFCESVGKVLCAKRASGEKRHFVSLLNEQGNEKPQPGSRKYPEYVNSAIRYIQENLSRRVTLDELAESAQMSKYHFSRAFKDITGMTPMRFLKYMKVQKAKILLCEEGNTVSRVASQVGFSDTGSFIRCFKSFEELTPAAYRTLRRGV